MCSWRLAHDKARWHEYAIRSEVTQKGVEKQSSPWVLQALYVIAPELEISLARGHLIQIWFPLIADTLTAVLLNASNVDPSNHWGQREVWHLLVGRWLRKRSS